MRPSLFNEGDAMKRSFAVGVAAAVIGVALVATEQPTRAWGRVGHRIVARVAAKKLADGPKQRVAAIFGTTAAGVEAAMVDAATWPDEIDKVHTGTRNWHFVDAKITGSFSTQGLCNNHDCVVDQIANMRTRLQTNQTGFTLDQPPSPSRPMTSQELAFLIHFVGDVHQPLHAATNGDRGGNCVPLIPPIHHDHGGDTTELHAFWDDDEVDAVVARHGGTEDQAATALAQQPGAVVQGTPRDWARESNALSRTLIYQRLHIPSHSAAPGDCVPHIAPVKMPANYISDTVAATERQLRQAGIRLANVLNEICAGTGCAANP
jgi:hypothetical protein